MAQNNVDFSGNPSGAGLLDDYLAKKQQNDLSSNSGIQRPSYAVAGTMWLDTSLTPWILKVYDGTDDIIQGYVDPTNNKYIPTTPTTSTGDLIVQGTDGNPARLGSGAEGTILTSNGPDKIPSYKVNPIGVLTYSSSYTYKKDQVVIAIVDEETALYKSLIDSNVGNSLDDDTKWEKLVLGGGVGDIGDINYTLKTEVPNGGAWCDGAEYTQAMFPDVYQMLVDGKISSTDFTTFDSTVSSNGSCGLFALDTTSEKFKVPLLKDVYIKAGDTPLAFGEESLPNITGSAYAGAYAHTLASSGALFTTGEDYQRSSGSDVSPATVINIDASKISSSYQDGAKVNPDHVVYRAYVVLYSSAAEASVAQAAEFMTSLGGKANVNLDNITSEAKSLISGLGMPSNNFIELDYTLNTDTQYTAPANGYYVARVDNTVAGFVETRNNTAGIGTRIEVAGKNQMAFCPCSKGDIVVVVVTGSVGFVRFIYAEGEI